MDSTGHPLYRSLNQSRIRFIRQPRHVGTSVQPAEPKRFRHKVYFSNASKSPGLAATNKESSFR